MGDVRPLRPLDPELVDRTGRNMHELVEMGLVLYKGDGSDTYVVTDKLLRLLGTMLTFVELHARDAADQDIEGVMYEPAAWLEVKTEIGVLYELDHTE